MATMRITLNSDTDRLIAPEGIPLDVVSYHITGAGPSGDTFGITTTKTSATLSGVAVGEWNINEHSVVFAASDSLAHYILMMYEVSRNDTYAHELQEAGARHSKNENYIKMAQALPTVDFEKGVLCKLLNCANNQTNFKRHIESLLRKGLLAVDDYSFAALAINNDKK